PIGIMDLFKILHNLPPFVFIRDHSWPTISSESETFATKISFQRLISQPGSSIRARNKKHPSATGYTPIRESTQRMEIALMVEKIGGREESRDGEEPSVSAARLILRAKAGDTTAFDQIIVAHQRKILSLAWRMLGNWEDARDAAQETFLRV